MKAVSGNPDGSAAAALLQIHNPVSGQSLSVFQKEKRLSAGLPEGLDEVQICELVEVNKGLKNFDVEIIPGDQKPMY